MKEIADFDLEIPFKGKRDYLQSADVYDSALNHLVAHVGLSDLCDVRLLFRAFAQKVLRVTRNSEGGPGQALLTFTAGGEKIRLEFMETGREIASRRPYPEEKIVERCNLELDRECVLLANDGNPEFSLLESIVAVNKELHLKLFGPSGKWLFTEVRTAKPLLIPGWREVRVQIKSRLGTKLTRSTITIDGEEAGYICFSLKPAF